MDEYIYIRLEPVDLSRRVLKKDAQQVKLDEKEKTQFRGLIAALNWTVREGRPHAAAAAASILAAKFPDPTPSFKLVFNQVKNPCNSWEQSPKSLDRRCSFRYLWQRKISTWIVVSLHR